MSTILQILTLLGAVTLFLFGLNLLSSGLQKVAGDGLRRFLASVTSNAFKQIITGIGITAVILLTARYIALATLLCTVLLPVCWWIETKSIPELLILLIPTVCTIAKHIRNLKRIANGTEIKFGKKKKDKA